MSRGPDGSIDLTLTSTSDDGGDSSGFSLPGWISALKPLAQAVERHGWRGAIRFVVATWIVGGIVTAWRELLAIGLQAGDAVSGAIGAAVGGLGAGFGGAGSAILAVLGELVGAIVSTAVSAGPLGWVILAAGFMGLVVGLYRFGLWLLDVVDVPIINLGALADGVLALPRRLWGLIR